MATSLVAWDCSPQVGLDRLMQLQLLHPLSELSSGARLVRSKRAFRAKITIKPIISTTASDTKIRVETVPGESANASVPRMKTRPLIRQTRKYSGMVHCLRRASLHPS
jgi:hypothetical protein